MERGYFGMVFYEPRIQENIGTAIRSAHCFGADFLGVIGRRYRRQPTDTMKSSRHLPFFEWRDLEDFLAHVPIDCKIVAVEVDGESLFTFVHPERAIYLFGGEDRNVPESFHTRIRIDTSHCLNLSAAASIVVFHRAMQVRLRMSSKSLMSG